MSGNISQQGRLTGWFRRSLLALLCLLGPFALPVSLAAQADPCTAVRAYKDAVNAAKQDQSDLDALNKKKPDKAKLADAVTTADNQLTQDAAAVDEAKQKLADATASVADKKTANAKALTDLAAKYPDLDNQIQKAQAAIAERDQKLPEAEKQKIKDEAAQFKTDNIAPLETAIKGQVLVREETTDPDTKLKTARMVPASSSDDARSKFTEPIIWSDDGNPSVALRSTDPNVNKIIEDKEKELQQATGIVNNLRNVEAKGGVDTGILNSGTEAAAKIPGLKAQLEKLYEDCQPKVQANLGRLLNKTDDLHKIEDKLNAGLTDEQKQLIDSLPDLQKAQGDKAALVAKKAELESSVPQEVTDAQKKYDEAVKKKGTSEKDLAAAKAAQSDGDAWDFQWQSSTTAKANDDANIAKAKPDYDAAVADKEAAVSNVKAAMKDADAVLTEMATLDAENAKFQEDLKSAKQRKQALIDRAKELKAQAKLTKEKLQLVKDRIKAIRDPLIAAKAALDAKAQAYKTKKAAALTALEAAQDAFESKRNCFGDPALDADDYIGRLKGYFVSAVPDADEGGDELAALVPDDAAGVVLVTANLQETVTNGSATSFMTTATLTANFADKTLTGALSGTSARDVVFDGKDDNQNVIDHATVHYDFNYSANVSGSIDPATGAFQIAIAPAGDAPAQLTQPFTNDKCTYLNSKPIPGAGPFTGSGTISGTISPQGKASFNTRWDASGASGAAAHVSGSWQGIGTVQTPVAQAVRSQSNQVCSVIIQERAP